MHPLAKKLQTWMTAMWRKNLDLSHPARNATSYRCWRLLKHSPPSVAALGLWFGPGFMWGGGWSSFGGFCPLMMVVMMCDDVACRFMCFGAATKRRG